MLIINQDLEIDPSELGFAASRSAGPGGQNVNKVATRVTLSFDLSSPSLSPEQRQRIRERLATRINKEGVLRVSSSRHRTQSANRRAATERFVELVQGALAVERPRRPTRVPPRSKRRRLESKRRRGELKRRRSRLPKDD